MSLIFRLLAATALFGGLAAPVSAHETVLRGRLVFGDHEASTLRILDLDTGKVTHSFDVPQPNPSLDMTADGRFVVVRVGDEAGTVKFFDSGLLREPHGDHVDIDKADPGFVDLKLTGDKPAHVLSGHGWISVFFDGQRPWVRPSEARADLIPVAGLESGKPERLSWKSPAPQHGVAVPLGDDRWFLSTPNPAYAKGDDTSASSRPNSFDLVDARDAWKPIGSYTCPLMHGHAELDGVHAFGCADGLAILQADGAGSWNAERFAYPDERVSSAITASGEIMVGNYGKSGSPFTAFLRIDPSASSAKPGDVFDIPDGQQACQFALAGDGRTLVHLAGDGKLRLYEVTPTWKEVARFDAVAPFDCAFGAPTPTPRLALSGTSAYISDPIAGTIHEFYLATRKQGLDYSVGGAPSTMAGGPSGG